MNLPKCDRCGKDQKELGAILLSPPVGKLVVKIHICAECYKKVVKAAKLECVGWVVKRDK
jgi:hypothetical protein